MGMLWLPIWCSVLVGLWGSVRVEAQDASADRTPIFELHFDEDSLRVVRNEMRRPQRAGSEAGLDSGRTEAASRAASAPRFPFQAVANNQAKKIVWFNTDGTIKSPAQYSRGPQGPSVGTTEPMSSWSRRNIPTPIAGTQQVELQDAQGARLWEAELHQVMFVCPPQERW